MDCVIVLVLTRSELCIVTNPAARGKIAARPKRPNRRCTSPPRPEGGIILGQESHEQDHDARSRGGRRSSAEPAPAGPGCRARPLACPRAAGCLRGGVQGGGVPGWCDRRRLGDRPSGRKHRSIRGDQHRDRAVPALTVGAAVPGPDRAVADAGDVDRARRCDRHRRGPAPGAGGYPLGYAGGRGGGLLPAAHVRAPQPGDAGVPLRPVRGNRGPGVPRLALATGHQLLPGGPPTPMVCRAGHRRNASRGADGVAGEIVRGPDLRDADPLVRGAARPGGDRRESCAGRRGSAPDRGHPAGLASRGNALQRGNRLGVWPVVRILARAGRGAADRPGSAGGRPPGVAGVTGRGAVVPAGGDSLPADPPALSPSVGGP